ncbi:MAG: PLDc N-terminal domain-containing protein [Phycisphaerae bacterium]|nr:PLDc N-terminal domain-containing protein [Phycisphaerae bacterium]
MLGVILGIILVTHIVLHKHTPTGTIAWLLIVLLVPYVGIPLYLMFGGRKMRRTAHRKSVLGIRKDKVMPSDDAALIDRLLQGYGMPGAETGNRLELCKTDVHIYECLTHLIEEAEASIYMSTYVFQKDRIGLDILQRLTRKAEQGVTVRVLMDGVGSLGTNKRFFKPLVEAGGRIAYFIPVLHAPFRGSTNLRNHRKIVAVDEQIVMAGGTNIGEVYIGPETSARRWCDIAFRLQGPSVRHYVDVFCEDWAFASGETLTREPRGQVGGRDSGDHCLVQVVPSGPDVPNDALYDVLLSAVYGARQRVWIVTPYFVPDEALSQALELAARRGVEVRLLLPEKSNHPLADIVRGNYLRRLQHAGASIHLYLPTMMHAKMVLIDHEVLVVGSANIDIRSLFLNYEVALLCYTGSVIDEAEQWIDTLKPHCRVGVAEAGLARSLFEGVMHILAPLL